MSAGAKRLGLLLLAVSAGCATTDRVALVSALAALSCDMAQTAESADEHWKYSDERNPVLHGRGPAAVVTYGVVAAGLTALAWYLAPRGARTAVGAAVTGVSAVAVNSSYHRSHACFGKGERKW